LDDPGAAPVVVAETSSPTRAPPPRSPAPPLGTSGTGSDGGTADGEMAAAKERLRGLLRAVAAKAQRRAAGGHAVAAAVDLAGGVPPAAGGQVQGLACQDVRGDAGSLAGDMAGGQRVARSRSRSRLCRSRGRSNSRSRSRSRSSRSRCRSRRRSRSKVRGQQPSSERVQESEEGSEPGGMRRQQQDRPSNPSWQSSRRSGNSRVSGGGAGNDSGRVEGQRRALGRAWAQGHHALSEQGPSPLDRWQMD
jgi:hypothetical protein